MVKRAFTASNSTVSCQTASLQAAAPDQVNLIDILVRGWARPEVPIAIVGNPGSGKTAQIEAFSRAYDLPLVKVLASTMNETDVGGILVYDQLKDMASLKRNDLFVRLANEGGVLFLDEFNTARKEVADTLLTLIQSRELPGGHKLPLNTLIVAAMNDADQCDNYELSPAMRNRFMWIHQDGKISDWWQFMLGKNNRLGAKKQALETPMSQEDFLYWFQQPQNAVEQKHLISWGMSKGLNYSDNDIIMKQASFTTARSLTNLLYWTRDVKDFLFWASAFIHQDDALLLNTISARALKNMGNAVFDDSFDQVDSGDESENLRLKLNGGIVSRIKQAAH